MFNGDDYMHTLKIENLSVTVNEKQILDEFNLEIKSGEIHAIMGPNGTGKSTLSKVIMGSPNYKIIKGNIYFDFVILGTVFNNSGRNLMVIFLAEVDDI